MATILHIETSTQVCSAAISIDGVIACQLSGEKDNDHAAQLAILTTSLLDTVSLPAKNLSAVAVSAGPGSYTGLRIGASFAKGLCHALQIPLISINTLLAMAAGAKDITATEAILLAPLIDARRMEVYTALYSSQLECLRKPEAVIMETNDFLSRLTTDKILFFGSGLQKIKHVLLHPNSIFLDNYQLTAQDTLTIAWQLFHQKVFSDISEFEPDYIKPFSGVARLAAESNR